MKIRKLIAVFAIIFLIGNLILLMFAFTAKNILISFVVWWLYVIFLLLLWRKELKEEEE